MHEPEEAAKIFAVALLAEGVDRNEFLLFDVLPDWVALLAEGVDRNTYPTALEKDELLSPSSRRAWIEML